LENQFEKKDLLIKRKNVFKTICMASREGGLNLRTNDLLTDHSISIGLKSGE